MTDDRLQREREFHDSRFSDERGRPAARFYAINKGSDTFYKAELAKQPPGSEVLDYGCGEGAYAAIEAARQGHRVMAIDLSPVAIEHARSKAEDAGVAANIDFQVMNAEALDVEADRFDFVCGLGVIHHLDLEASLAEVARVMKPSAGALLIEPLGHNPVINAYRRRTPDQRTVDEHPLVMDDLSIVRAHFAQVDETYFHLLGLLALPLVGRRRFDDVLDGLDALDRVVFRTRLRRYAWMLALRLTGPRP
jgi:ubiquinone/menaquinone biosynthesis C-methylase UbiE